MGRNEQKAKEDAIEIIEKNDENNDKVIDFNEFKTTYYRILLSAYILSYFYFVIFYYRRYRPQSAANCSTL